MTVPENSMTHCVAVELANMRVSARTAVVCADPGRGSAEVRPHWKMKWILYPDQGCRPLKLSPPRHVQPTPSHLPPIKSHRHITASAANTSGSLQTTLSNCPSKKTNSIQLHLGGAVPIGF